MNAKEFSLWTLLTILWGGSFLAIGIGVETLDPLTLVAGRMLIAALVLVSIVYLSGNTLRLGARGWSIAAVAGLTGNIIPFLLISYAEQEVNSGMAALIMGITPIVTLAVAPLIHPDETLGKMKILGAAAGFAGIAILVGPSALSGTGGYLVPKLALVFAALCYSFTTLFSRRFAFPDPLQLAAAAVLVGALTSTTIALFGFQHVGRFEWSYSGALTVLYLGLGPTALATLVYFYLVPRIGAGRLSQVNYVVPILGTLLGMTFLSERPDWNTWVAIPVILFGVFLVSRNSSSSRRKTAGSDQEKTPALSALVDRKQPG
ncbi:putative inner membrane transporter YedA [Roseibium album]|nr:putative inner membrane transporter YedA [Roseibium album]